MVLGRFWQHLTTWYRTNVAVFWHKYSSRVTNIASLALFGLLVTVGMVTMYRYYMSKRLAKAQVSFAEIMHEYQSALHGNDKEWTDVRLKSASSYDADQKGTMAPYLLMLEADALVHDGKLELACDRIDNALTAIPKNSPIYPIYKTKRALIKLDIGNAASKQQGLDELSVLAYDVDNKNRDYAQYFLGLYHWSHQDIASAIRVWRELLTAQKQERLSDSPWARLAREKLAQVTEEDTV